jgi:hypothetical protein
MTDVLPACVAMVLMPLAGAVWSGTEVSAAKSDPPESESQPITTEADEIEAGPSPGDHPPPAMRVPGLERGERPAQPRGRRRLFGHDQPRPTYENLSEEQRLLLESFLARYFPELFEELKRLDFESPQQFERLVNRMLPQMLHLMRMERDDPEMFPFRKEEVRLSAKIRSLSRRVERGQRRGRDVEKMVAGLRGLLEQRFDARLQGQRLEVDRLAARLADARAHLDHAGQDKEEIIDRELEQLLERGEGRLAPPRRQPPPQGGQFRPLEGKRGRP